jgi:hemerythrin-like domain-containing protein
VVGAIVRFAEKFADGRHHEKEEKVLFVEMQSRGFSGSSGPLACMLGQHETGRRLVSVLRHWTHGTADERERYLEGMVHAAIDYVELLSSHISVEDSVLFPAALAHLPNDALMKVGEAYGNIDPPSWREELTTAADEVVALVSPAKPSQF